MRLQESLCLGIAGNFAKHLQQAGELEDFKEVITSEQNAPKGLFPFYTPHSDNFLGIFPIDTDKLALPSYNADVHMEPEIGMLFDAEYSDGKVISLHAKKFTVFNDATIRKDGASKISQKKSWGSSSKGIGKKWIEIDQFEPGGIMDRYSLCSFVKRDGELHPYGVDAPLVGYSYFHDKLKDWILEKLNTQSDFGPLEDMPSLLKACGYPSEIFVTIGATAYAEFGENNYLADGDTIYVIAYDNRADGPNLESSSTKLILEQKVSK